MFKGKSWIKVYSCCVQRLTRLPPCGQLRVGQPCPKYYLEELIRHSIRLIHPAESGLWSTVWSEKHPECLSNSCGVEQYLRKFCCLRLWGCPLKNVRNFYSQNPGLCCLWKLSQTAQAQALLALLPFHCRGLGTPRVLQHPHCPSGPFTPAWSQDVPTWPLTSDLLGSYKAHFTDENIEDLRNHYRNYFL